MHQTRLREAIKVNVIHAWDRVDDLPNGTQRTRGNKPRGPCSDPIADTKLEWVTHT